MADKRIESMTAMLYPLAHLVAAKGMEDVTVRFAKGKLRDVQVDGRFYTLIDGKWFRLDKVGR